MKLAFYAPLKPPEHPVPSGDRTMARAIIAVLERLGGSVDFASTQRSRDGTGDADVQDRILAEAAAKIPRIIDHGRTKGWQAWITYHCYYKAPDLIGPAVCRVLDIPYLQIEATRAKKRLTGPWARFAQASEAAIDAADVVFYFTKRDAEALEQHALPHQHLIHLAPFLARNSSEKKSDLSGPMLSVGMMRDGDKLASYQIIAETLGHLSSGWQLSIAGDGPARARVEAMMAPYGDAVTFLGLLDETELNRAYENASLLFWPGVNEAFGLSYIEAQARGLPVVAQDRPAVREVLASGTYPTPEQGSGPLAARLEALLSNEALRQQAGADARAYVNANHLAPSAMKTLAAGLAAVGVGVAP